MAELTLLRTTVVVFLLAALGGLLMAGIRFGGKRNPPAWLAMLNGGPVPAERASAQYFFEEGQRSWIFTLALPEDRGPADLGVATRSDNVDQRRHAFIRRPLRQGAHRLLADLEVSLVVRRNRIEFPRRRLSRCLPDPEEEFYRWAHRELSRLPTQPTVRSTNQTSRLLIVARRRGPE